jgi:hypothetical protein
VGSTCSDNNSAYEGYDWDLNRWGPLLNSDGSVNSGSVASRAPARDSVNIDPPDSKGNGGCTERFGSAHPAGFHAVFADGSVHLLQFSIDLAAFGKLTSRNDGHVHPHLDE